MIKSRQQHNKQNNLIIKQMNKAQRAISDLISKGITVLNVEMARQKPRIEIQAPRSELPSETLVIRGTKNGIREDINFSTLNGCIIFWKI
ncbi:hypothetical protein A9Q74_06145 [Colwellia sp. 39_35_sub15_T18]|nr:hypothetical protein A9Q74_06145 [Colwellia sp. 39_35_sub15_T18]